MAFEKTTFVDGQTVITAEVLNRIQDYIIFLERGKRVVEISLPAANWMGSEMPYSQVVTIDEITETSRVDLTPTVEQLALFYEKDLNFVTENDGGVVTVYVIGQKPEDDYVIPATITEVFV